MSRHSSILEHLESGLAVPRFVPFGPARRGFDSRRGLWMPWCCGSDDCPYGGPPDCQADADGTVSWFTHTVDEDTGEITRNNHSGSCYTVYVNSTSGDVAETGNGTSTRPFVNLNSIFSGNVTKSGSGTLSSGVFTPGSAPTEWAVGRLIGAKLVLDSTDYEVTANTTTTATIADPPDDGSYSWTLKIFDDDCIYYICSRNEPPFNYDCSKVKVLVKGTIDYQIDGKGNYPNYWKYNRNLIIEPWTPSATAIVLDGAQFSECKECIWKLVQSIAGSTHFSGCGGSAFDACEDIGFYACYCSAFHECTGGFNTCAAGVSHTPTYSTFKSCSSTTGFDYCGSSFFEWGPCVFDTCTVSGSGSVGFSYNDICVFRNCDSSALGFYGGFTYCSYSTFINCTGGASPSQASGFYHCTNSEFAYCTARRFDVCTTSSFDHCTAIIDVRTYPQAASGFYGCTSSTFSYCVGTGTGYGANDGNWTFPRDWTGTGYGFVDCGYSTFEYCDGTGVSHGFGSGDPSATGLGVGFALCEFSLFEYCNGVGEATEPGCRRACGFYGNTCSAFVGCTTSDRICEDCSSATCNAFVCDDFDNDVEWTEETPEGVLTLTPTHSTIERETLEGVLKLEPTHSVLDIRETLEGVLSLAITHSIE